MSDILDSLQSALADRYRIERELGRGGMATVYLAHDLRHDRSVALKVLRPELAHAVGADRFLREIRLCARLQHPHILGVHDSGEAGGQLWFTMPYVDGETLRSRLAREQQLPIGDAVRITTEIADALTYAHGRGVIHRDIKPENILLSGNHALVADFGIARALRGGAAAQQGSEEDERLTETGMSLGTPQYMSPEQSVGERELDARTDVYSLGCVLYEMLAGEPPFTGPNPQSVLAKRLSEPVPHIRSTREVPLAIDHAVTRALARAPADRFATAAEFAAALGSTSVESGSSTAPVTSRQSPRKRRWIGALIGAVLVILLGGYMALGRSGGGAPGLPASAAVLPFTDLSPGKDQEYFSDGLTEELITSLSQVKGIRVAARTSSFQFKGQNADIRDVGRKLGVGAVLEGSVRKSGDRLRVTAQLSSAEDGYQLWSESYDRDLADVFAVQEEIARAIVGALRVRLGGGTRLRPGARVPPQTSRPMTCISRGYSPGTNAPAPRSRRRYVIWRVRSRGIRRLRGRGPHWLSPIFSSCHLPVETRRPPGRRHRLRRPGHSRSTARRPRRTPRSHTGGPFTGGIGRPPRRTFARPSRQTRTTLPATTGTATSWRVEAAWRRACESSAERTSLIRCRGR